ncbi:M20 family metallopeptidase [Acidaminobacter hydrogenoformans]|uniref:Succinyl-diaminopimelate desuccinylase n=1 Tax=Acidaminobacter hydrogenoformans DSM 2784 TaxID=1120920 RepID=A0A1G5S0Y2_9FIRM|nr:M20/M25/M40 family metallo-hydrolase [Acidaminobacter hydrogenoformans]SCZ80045.1 succinyl-diaminopimelate desuccinylase [Acidaminobacter hydrogenoformans DSM 2784]
MKMEQNEVITLLQALVAVPSPYFKEEQIMALVNDWFISNGFKPVVHDYHEDQVTDFHGKNLIVTLQGSQPGPTICFNGHLDSVQLSSGWTKDPYAGDREGDRLYGLGALDMKSGCAATMIALKAFKAQHQDFKGKIISTYVSVEEGPYGMGTNALIEEGLLEGVDISIVTEPSAGFTHKPFPVVCLGARGGYGLEIEFFGKAAHAALPSEGVSAALDAAKVVAALEDVEYRVDPHLGTGAACVVGLESDGGACSVPDYAKIKLFWHIVVGENEDTIREEIEKAIDRASIRSTWKINFREAPSEGSKGFMPFTVSETQPMVAKFLKSIKQTLDTDYEIDYFQSIGDFNYLGTRLNAPTIIFGPSGGNFHGPDEYVDIESVVQTAQVIYQYLVDTLSIDH